MDNRYLTKSTFFGGAWKPLDRVNCFVYDVISLNPGRIPRTKSDKS